MPVSWGLQKVECVLWNQIFLMNLQERFYKKLTFSSANELKNYVGNRI